MLYFSHAVVPTCRHCIVRADIVGKTNVSEDFATLHISLLKTFPLYVENKWKTDWIISLNVFAVGN